MDIKLEIFSEFKKDFDKIIEKYNKKALKITGEQIKYKVDKTSMVDINECIREKLSITISEPSVLVFNEYEVVAKLDHTYVNEGETHITPYKFDIDLTGYRYTSSTCQCCNSKRRRNFTYIVRNLNDNSIKQVGSSCIENYVGVQNILPQLEFLGSLEDKITKDLSKVSTKNYAIFKWYNLKDLLVYIHCHLKKNKYVSVKEGERSNKRSTVTAIIDELKFEEYKNILKRTNHTEEDIEIVDTALEYMIDYIDNSKDNNDFMKRLGNTLSYEYVKKEDLGVVCSFFKTLEILKKKEIKKEDCFGEINQIFKEEVKLIDRNYIYRNDFNKDIYAYTFEVKKGTKEYTLVWKTDKILENIKDGEILNLKFKIKKHELSYKNSVITNIFYCKVS